jgi:nicotinate-nucleotide adenylyltransferase
MKIGLFFGSFNPVHVGHLIIAECALNETDLDRVWMVVSPQNPLKVKSSLLGEYDRFRMMELALNDHPKIQASNVEFMLPKPSYTVDTLLHLREKYPSYEFSIIMGEDNLEHFHKWKNYEAILNNYTIYCYPRIIKEQDYFQKYPQVKKFGLPYLDISATFVREMLAQKKSVRFMVTDRVYEYILKNNLYAG